MGSLKLMPIWKATISGLDSINLDILLLPLEVPMEDTYIDISEWFAGFRFRHLAGCLSVCERGKCSSSTI